MTFAPLPWVFKSKFEEIKKKTEQSWQEILERVEDDTPEEVYQLNLQLLTMATVTTFFTCVPDEDIAGSAGTVNPGKPTTCICKAASEQPGTYKKTTPLPRTLTDSSLSMQDTSGTHFIIEHATINFKSPKNTSIPIDDSSGAAEG